MAFKLKPNEKYIFATDLDGTFLTHFNSSLHIDSFEAVRKIKEAGHHFVITTGRSWWWVRMLYEQLDSIDAAVHFSGAQIHHPKNKGFEEYRKSIKKEIIWKFSDELNIWDYIEAAQAVGRNYHAFFAKGDDLKKVFFNCYEFIVEVDLNKINLKEFEDKLTNIIGDGFIIRTWNIDNSPNKKHLIISPQGTNKAEALKKISKFYNVPTENVIYFGDNVNDLEALEWAGYSIVPSNAKQQAKDHSDEILKLSNDEGAVPKKMLELLEGK